MARYFSSVALQKSTLIFRKVNSSDGRNFCFLYSAGTSQTAKQSRINPKDHDIRRQAPKGTAGAAEFQSPCQEYGHTKRNRETESLAEDGRKEGGKDEGGEGRRSEMEKCVYLPKLPKRTASWRFLITRDDAGRRATFPRTRTGDGHI